ncbi:DUF6979 family protein [Morganella morganii]|uniref:DUF6979 family protein n=1 Tax=Morganella morganii TaxID=582 RepID=UPI001E5F39DA|nr:hypothetical protein [Morganella morganii]UFH69707.1 hypothetical protein KQH80_06715 [Morganella morganii]
MATYGKTAVQTVLNYDAAGDLAKQWEVQISSLTQSGSVINKGCPRAAFLGLCEEGVVKNIPENNYGAGEKNKHHALKILELAQANSGITAAECFRMYQESNPDLPKTHNGQADVVISLLEANLIK